MLEINASELHAFHNLVVVMEHSSGQVDDALKENRLIKINIAKDHHLETSIMKPGLKRMARRYKL